MHAIPPDRTELLGKAEDITLSFDKRESSLRDAVVGHQEIVMLRSPINKCPSEVLSMIFRLATHETPTHVRRLLLICKIWYRLAIGDPLMWSTITLTLNPDPWNVRWWVRQHRLFVEMCLERSRSTLLDITLDLGSLQSMDEQHEEKRRINNDNEYYRFRCPELVKTYPHYWLAYDAWDDEEEYDERFSWDGEDEPNPIYRERDPERHSTPEHVFALLKELTGPEGKLMGRWKSLDLIFPAGDDMAHGIWNVISYPLPNLSRLRLDMDLPVYEDYDGFESLHFTINEVNNWRFLAFLPPSLQELSVPTTLETSFLCQLSRLTRLSSLTILPAMAAIDYNEASPPPQPTMRVELPFLQNLRIETLPEYMSRAEFTSPNLENLVLILRCEDHEWLEFPTVEPVPNSIHWESRKLPQACAMISAKAIMRRILLHFDGAQNLSVPDCVKDAFLDLLREMKSEGSLPRSWKTATFCVRERPRETVDIATS